MRSPEGDSKSTRNTVSKKTLTSITPKEIQVYDDAVPEELYSDMLKLSKRVRWQYGWNTPSNPTARYWHHEVGFGNKRNTDCIAETVRKHPAKLFTTYMEWLLGLLPAETKILRFYLNSYTFGTDGWPHTDTDREGEQTVILYLTQDWDPAWSGATVIFDDEGDVSHSVMPKRNRVLTFPSDLLHAPRPLARAFNGLRIVLVVKLGFKDVDSADTSLLDFADDKPE